MKKFYFQYLTIAFSILLSCNLSAQKIPYLKKREKVTQLIVHDKPFIMLAGELHNSSSSSILYLEPIWDRIKALNLNSVIASVSWEMVEQQEGVFDFTIVDGIIKSAQKNNLKLALIWFATWKNGTSAYAPLWVKKDTKRFFRVKDRNNNNTSTISPFCEEAKKADARAYSQLMKHIKQLDSIENTVVIMQVENEMGMFQVQDYGAESAKAYQSPVPGRLLEYMLKNENTLQPELKACWVNNGKKNKGSWAEIFGNSMDSHEFLNAWQYAGYVNEVAKAGKKEYPLPMYVNAWLINDPASTPGMYPCGGPVSKVMDIYKAAASELEFLAPDIYIPRFKEVCNQYHRFDNPLFIPEHANNANTAAGDAFWAFAQHDAICFAPFGIESMEDKNNIFASSYETLRDLLPLIAKYQGTGQMQGILWEKNDTTRETKITLGSKQILIKYIKSTESVFGLIIQTSSDQYIIAGRGFEARFPKNGDKTVGIGSIKELKCVNGEWVEARWFNGDESLGNGARLVNYNFDKELPAMPLIIKIQTYEF